MGSKIAEKKHKMVMEILEYLRGPYTVKSGFIEHVRRGLEKMSEAQLGNLYCLIDMKSRSHGKEGGLHGNNQ